MVLAHVVELVWVLKVDVVHHLEHHLEFEFIYLHGLVLARKSTCVSKKMTIMKLSIKFVKGYV